MEKVNCILLVEDDPTDNFINELVLSSLNFAKKIVIAKNGAEAIDYLSKNCGESGELCPEIIFLDINMPVMDGFEFARAVNISENLANKDRRIIVLSSSVSSRDIKKMETEGIKEFVSKPLTKDKVINLFSNGS